MKPHAFSVGFFYFYPMKFKVGDKVAFLNEVGQGKVLRYNGDEVVVEDEDGFDNTYSENELVLKGHLEVQGVEQKDNHLAKKMDQSSAHIKSVLEIDLHFNKLVDFPKNFSNSQMINIQLREARTFLDRAKKSGNKRVVLIHGVGNGRLKEEIHTLLERMDGLRFYDASYAEYGTGATEVEFF